ncbi:MAG: Gfo/Idh/MocA family oxidoreductase [Planctomycetia bacterium]|nr:Gfo/Idh/MocA family oxidoreductase [Planctomycetia bacterium]
MGTKEYNVAILGGGFIGKVHAYAYATLGFYSNPLPLRARVRYVVNSRQETADAAAALLAGAKGRTDWENVVRDPEIDIIHVCTPNDLHFPMLQAAISEGKHIYCEKPVVMNASEGARLAALLENYRGVSHVVFHTRYFAAALKAKEMIDAGKLGRILEFRGAYLQNSHVDPARPMRWKNLKESGGGVLNDIGSHLVDFADWLVGPLEKTHAFASSPEPSDLRRAADSMTMIWSAQNGAIGSLHISKVAHGTENDFMLEVYGTRGAVRFQLMDAHFLDYCDGAKSTAPFGGDAGWTRVPVGNRYAAPDTDFPATKSGVGWVRAHCTCLADFLRAVATGSPSPMNIDLRRGIYIQELLQKAEDSALCANFSPTEEKRS